MNPMLYMLKLISRTLRHARHVIAKGDPTQTQGALAAAEEIVNGAITEFDSQKWIDTERQRRACQYGAPFSNN